MKNIICFLMLGCAASFGAPPAGSIVVDSDAGDASVVHVGSWTYRAIGQGNNGTYDHDGNTLKGSKSVQLIPNLPSTSTYNVYLNWVSNNNRASNAPVTINYDGGSTTVTVNQQNNGDWVLLGSFPFVAGNSGSLLIETTGTDGYVIADAAAWEAVDDTYEKPEISIVATVPETTEGDIENPAAITLTRSGSNDFQMDVALAASGTATGGEDYHTILEDNFFGSGETNRTFLITAYEDEIVEGSETVTITLLADSDYTLGSNTAATVTLADSPFDIWRDARFTAGELAEPNVSGALADPDGDERNNLAEFFADTNPTVMDSAPGMEIAHDGTNVQLSAIRNPSASLLEVQLETSSTLSEWQPAVATIEVMAGSNGTNDLLSFEVPANHDAHQFWRTAVSQPDPMQRSTDGIAYWSFDTQFDGAGDPTEAITYLSGFMSAPVISQSGSAAASVTADGADAFFGPDGNTWSGTGHSLTWNAGSTGNGFSIELNTLLQKEIRIRFDVRSSLTHFTALTVDTGMGPLDIPDADLVLTNNGAFNEWTIDLSTLDAVNSRSSVVLTWSFDDLAVDESVQIDNLVISGTGRAKSQLVRNLEAGRAQTVVMLGTSLTDNGAYVGLLADVLNSNYCGLATVLNSGKAGKNSDYGVANFDSLVIQKEPDTLFVEYGINDSVERFDLSVADAEANLTYIVDGTLASFPDCEIILMTMTPGDKYEPGHTSYRKDIQDYYAMYCTFARERGYRVVDHYSSWTALQTNDVDQFNSYVPDTIHPGDAGNEAVVLPALIDVLGIAKAE